MMLPLNNFLKSIAMRLAFRAPASAYHALFLKHVLISWNMFL